MAVEKWTSEIVASILAASLAARSPEALDPPALVKLYLTVKEELEKALARPPRPPPDPEIDKRLREESAKAPPRNRFARSR